MFAAIWVDCCLLVVLQTSLRLLVLEGNERLEETPPAEQGPELLQVLEAPVSTRTVAG